MEADVRDLFDEDALFDPFEDGPEGDVDPAAAAQVIDSARRFPPRRRLPRSLPLRRWMSAPRRSVSAICSRRRLRSVA